MSDHISRELRSKQKNKNKSSKASKAKKDKATTQKTKKTKRTETEIENVLQDSQDSQASQAPQASQGSALDNPILIERNILEEEDSNEPQVSVINNTKKSNRLENFSSDTNN